MQGLIFYWFIAAIKEVKIPRHLRVVLTDSISFNYTHLSHNDTSTTNCLNCLNWLNWLGVRKRISTFLALDRHFASSTMISLKNSTTNSLPPRSKLSRTHIIPSETFVSPEWSCPTFLQPKGFTFQDFGSITKLSRHHYIMCGIYKAWYILRKKTLKITKSIFFVVSIKCGCH